MCRRRPGGLRHHQNKCCDRNFVTLPRGSLTRAAKRPIDSDSVSIAYGNGQAGVD
jgi:hypothetical protein